MVLERAERWAAPVAVPRGRLLAAATHPLAAGALAAGAVGYLAAVDPNRPGHYPTCPFFLLTGRYCPGCGGLRAVHDLAHGQLLAALSANLLVVLAVPVLAAFWLDWTRHRLTGRTRLLRLPSRLASRLGWLLIVVLLAFCGLRNLPVGSWLAP